MKTINAKRIAAVAASLLMGLAFAGSGGVTWQNIPIINNQGQPVVQVVVGSTAQPSDGVVAANIAAVLGNLAFTSVNVTATPSGLSNVHCVVTTPTCTLTNQQVWFNEKGFAAPSGSYAFTALIGSVFNGGLGLGSPVITKSISTSSTYAYPAVFGNQQPGIQLSPQASPYAQYQSPPTESFSATTNGGGLSPSGFGASGFRSSNNYDNLLLVTNAQLPALLNNWGTYGQTDQLWFTGEPVFDQQTSSPSVNNFAVFGAGGVYQAKFNKPVPYRGSGTSVNNAQIRFLGNNWTILNYWLPNAPTWNNAVGTGTVSSSNAIVGGALSLAATLTPIQTVYVGHNVSSGGFTVSLTDLGQPNAQGNSQASVNVYYNGTLTNTTQLGSGNTTKFSVQNGAHSVYVKVNQTFAGLYAYQKWAKIQLYSNIVNITSGNKLNTTNAPGFIATLWWTNASTTGTPNELASIQVINSTPGTAGPLLPGQSFTIATPNMSTYKLTFVGSTLGSNFDPVTFTTGTQTTGYQNTPGATGNGLGNVKNITEPNGASSFPYPTLTVQSQIPSAFSYAGQVGSTLVYNLEPYQLTEVANGVVANSVLAGGTALYPVNVVISSSGNDPNVITAQNPLTITVYGYTSSTQGGASSNTLASNSVTFTSIPGGVATLGLGENLFNVTGMQFSRVVPGLTANVVTSVSTGGLGSTPANTLARMSPLSAPQLLYYQTSGQSNYHITSGASVNYNQQNGQPLEYFNLTGTTPASLAGSHNYFTYNVVEYPVPGITSVNDVLELGISNSTAGVGASPYFQLNTSIGNQKNNVTYVSTQQQTVAAPTGFYTERGSKVASISSTSVTLDLAKAVDTLQFVVQNAKNTSSSSNTVLTSSVGPVGVGQAVPGFANLTVSKVNATCTFTSTSCSISGLSNLTATPSVTHSVVPVALNTATTPLVVLDSNANSAATLIVVGSKYVNSVAGQVFAQNPSLNSSFGTSSVVASAEGTNRILVAGYTANQTVQAGNEFINQLLQAAGSA